MMSISDKALRRYKKSKNRNHWDLYKEIRNYSTQAIKREKRAYFEHFFNTSNSREQWKFLSNNHILPQNKNRDIPDHLKNVNEISNFLTNLTTNLSASELLLNYYKNNPLNNNNFKFQTVSVNEALKLISYISTNATGCDGVNAKLLKLCCPHVIAHITHIVNVCLTENVFPILWKSS